MLFSNERVSVKPLLSIGGTYAVRMRKLDGTPKFCVNFPTSLQRDLESLTKDMSQFYNEARMAALQKPAVGDFVVFLNAPGM